MKLSNLNLSDHEDYYIARFKKVLLKKTQDNNSRGPQLHE